MKLLIYLIFIVCFQLSLSAQSTNYLLANRTNLRNEKVTLAQEIVGFTVIHGSSKAEDAELALIKSCLANADTLNYFPEIDAAMAYYLNSYLESGDEELLKDLILMYKDRVPQEASVAMYNKWKGLRKLSSTKYIQVYGIDTPVSYKYYAKLLSELAGHNKSLCDSLSSYLQNPDTDYSPRKETPLKQYLQNFGMQYQSQDTSNDTILLAYLMSNINNSFKKRVRRDSVMIENYIFLSKHGQITRSKQFIRMGVYHMMKECFANTHPGLVAGLIGNGIWKASDIYVVQAFLYDSKVLWQRTYDNSGRYTGYTEEGGFYAGEGLPGTQPLADNSLSDLTFFDLSGEQSPLRQFVGLDLGQLKLLPNKSLADYIDGAVLIKNSQANIPIEALK